MELQYSERMLNIGRVVKEDPEQWMWDSVCFTLMAFIITEGSVWGTALLFDYFAESSYLKPYVIRDINKIKPGQEHPDKQIKRAMKIRYEKYKSDWIIYLMAWCLSSIRYDTPSISDLIIDTFVLILTLDVYIFIAHWWLHSKWGKDDHSLHHTARYVSCWLVDHESSTESAILGIGKYAILVFYSPSAYSSYIYLFIAKFWNVLAHCGYNLPIFQWIDTYLPIIATPNLHEIHHHHHGMANLAVFTTILDYLFGTIRRDI